jgi:uncharacterized phiE125 gp8 family phage protein
MYGLQVITPPVGLPVTAAELRGFLRLNDDAEDALLTEFIKAATDRFEHDTGRPVLSTTYRQILSRWPASKVIVLALGGVTDVEDLVVYTANGTAGSPYSWTPSIDTPPSRVLLGGLPAQAMYRDAGYVTFIAGWQTPPATVKHAIKLLAAHFYERREAFAEGTLNDLPAGWNHVVRQYETGLTGDWGQ